MTSPRRGRAVAEAEEQLQTTQAELDEKAEGETESALLEQQTAVDAARRKIADEVANGEQMVADAESAVDAAVMALNAFLADRASKPSDRAKAEDELEKAVLAADKAERDAAEAVAAAEEALRLAELKLQEMTGPPDVDSETVARDQAQGAFDRATAALQDLEARPGPTVPLGEIVFVDARCRPP